MLDDSASKRPVSIHDPMGRVDTVDVSIVVTLTAVVPVAFIDSPSAPVSPVVTVSDLQRYRHDTTTT